MDIGVIVVIFVCIFVINSLGIEPWTLESRVHDRTKANEKFE